LVSNVAEKEITAMPRAMPTPPIYGVGFRCVL
jgi:hypothetical protein